MFKKVLYLHLLPFMPYQLLSDKSVTVSGQDQWKI